MKVLGTTRICGIIGDPIDHTLSPILHNAAFEALNLDFIYVPFRVRKDELGKAIIGLKSLALHGFNVTMPHKNAVLEYLDDFDSLVTSIGAVNTILNNKGRLQGFNTDGSGVRKALEENGVNLNNKKLLLLGAGGAAKAIAFSLAQEIKELTILNRTASKARALAERLQQTFNKEIQGNILSPHLARSELEDTDILVNATSVGMSPDVDQSLIDRSWLSSQLCVMDIIYKPKTTKLVKDAQAVGAKVISGIEMLIYQGAVSFEIWTNHKAPITVMRNAILKKLEVGSHT